MALHPSSLRARSRRTSPLRRSGRKRAVALLCAVMATVPAVLWSPAVRQGSGGAAAATCPSFQALVNAAPVGSTLTVPACTFHETVTISKKLTVNAKGAVIDGDNVRTKGLEIKANDVVVDGLTVKRISTEPTRAPSRRRASPGSRSRTGSSGTARRSASCLVADPASRS